MNKDVKDYRFNIRSSSFYKDFDRLKRQCRLLRLSKSMEVSKNKLKLKNFENRKQRLYMIAKDERNLKNAEMQLYRTTLRNQIFLKKYKARHVDHSNPRMTHEEIDTLREKIIKTRKKLRNRVYNNALILPGVQSSIKKVESNHCNARLKRFGVTNSSFMIQEKEFSDDLSRDSFYRKDRSQSLAPTMTRYFRNTCNSLKRKTTRKKLYRVIKNINKPYFSKALGKGIGLKDENKLCNSFYI